MHVPAPSRPQPAAPAAPGPPAARVPEPVLRALLLAGTAALYLVALGRNGWGNAFYAAAAQSGARNWTAFFFGSSDAANSITVDKPPAALWAMGLSVRLFGLSSWSLLVPQALMGVGTVALVAGAVRRAVGPWPGLLAGLLTAVTPVVTLMFRYDNPDALLTLLVVAAAWTTVRALADGRLRWTLATGALFGLAFLAKSLQAFLVLPAVVAVLLIAGHGPLRRRIGHVLAGGAALAVSGGWWFLAVALVPRADRPWVGGSARDSPLELAFGYNGLGRLAGQRDPGGHRLAETGSAFRLLGSAGDQVGWLLPAAAVGLVAGWLLVRRRPRRDPARAALILWGGWFVVAGAVLSLMRGISHPYYSVELAPAVAALVAVGATLLWRRATRRALLVLAATAFATTGWSMSLVVRDLPLGSPLSLAVGAFGLTGTAALVRLARSGAVDGGEPLRLRRVAAAAALLAAVVGPLGWSVATVELGHHGAAVRAGPAAPDQRKAYGVLPPAPPVSPSALTLLRGDPAGWTWDAAVVGYESAALQLALGHPVMPVGGFGGADPAPTLQAFRDDVRHHRVHWFVAGPRGTGQAAAISAWVAQHAPAVRAGTTTLYDVGALATDPPGHA